MPAGTGVWVVKTLLARAASSASSKLSLSLAHERRIRSSARKAEWPSFMWKTVGLRPSACKRAHAADAEHDLLPDARVDVAAVERIGDVAVLRQHVLRECWCRAGTA